MMKIITGSFIAELTKNTPKHFQILRKIQSLTTQERDYCKTYSHKPIKTTIYIQQKNRN